jgi:predicted 3-demethylubiquinone-9 3-methyltransferase (glyoxalase superfamily)
MTIKNKICLWYDKEALQAAQFYSAIFPNSEIKAIHYSPGDYPGGKSGDVITVEFTILGIACIGLNGGPYHKHSEAFSFQIATETQEETDKYWNALIGNGGSESVCGWCKDKWGISWQISPRILTEAIAGGGDIAKRAFAEMITMKKIDIAKIENAINNKTTS